MSVMYRSKQIMVLLSDLVAFALGLWLALAVRFLSLPSPELILKHIPLFSSLFAVWVVINFINGLYDLDGLRGARHYRRLLDSSLISLAISIAVIYLATPTQPLAPKTILLLNVFFGFGLSALGRLLYSAWSRSAKLFTRVILVGYTKEIQELMDILQNTPEKGFQVTALFDPDRSVKNLQTKSIALYHSLQALRPAITTHKAHLVVTAPHLKEQSETLRELYELLFWPVHLLDLSSFYEQVAGRVPPSTFSDGWFLSNLANIDQPIYNKFRRLTDYLAGLVIGSVCLILTPFIALAIKVSSRGPIFFGQKRVGQYGEIFTIYKYRTMYALSADGSAEKGEAQFAKKDDKRVTSVGRFLRKTRLDELPQFVNLLRGHITLIGPRPERPEIVAKLEAQMPYYPLRQLVKPGITGWAAINQHYTVSFDEAIQKLQYDLYYIKNRSLILDLSILLRTVNVVVRMMGQ